MCECVSIFYARYYSETSAPHLAAVKQQNCCEQNVLCSRVAFNVTCFNSVLPVCSCLVSRAATCLRWKMMKKHVELQTPVCLLRLVFFLDWVVVQHVLKMFTRRTCLEYKSLEMSFLFLLRMWTDDPDTYVIKLLYPIIYNLTQHSFW